MGYSFNTTIHPSNNDKLERWDNFIINSEEAIRKDPFFYKVIEGSIDYEYINNLIKE